MADKIIWNIARGFEKLNEKKLAAYYYKRLYHFYPQSKYRKEIKKEWLNDFKIPLEFYGKNLKIQKE